MNRTLAELVEEYREDGVLSCDNRTFFRLNAAIRRWRWDLGGEPTVANLAKNQLVAFVISLGRQGTPRETVQELACSIRSLWRRLYDRGEVDIMPPQRPIVPEEFEVVTPGKGSLHRYLDRVYAVETENSRRELIRNRQAINWLGYMLRRHAMLSDLTPETVQQFCKRSPVARFETNRCAKLLVQMGRHYDPTLFAEGMGKARYSAPREVKWVNDESEGTLRHYFETVYAPHKLRSATPEVWNLYRTSLRHFAKFLNRPPVFTDLEDSIVTEFVFSMKLNAQTVNSYRSKIICMWNYAFRKRKVESGPDVEALKEFRPEPVALTIEQLGRLFYAAAKFNRPAGGIAGIHPGAYWLSLCLALYDTGLRIGAIRKARVEHLELGGDNPSIYIPGQNQKTGKFARRPLHIDTVEVLRRSLQDSPERELVWPWEMTAKYFYDVAGEIFTEAGIEIRRKKFHLLRRSAATFVARRFDVEKARQYLQHTTVNTTLDHYIDQDQLDEDTRRMCDLLPRPNVEAP